MAPGEIAAFLVLSLAVVYKCLSTVLRVILHTGFGTVIGGNSILTLIVSAATATWIAVVNGDVYVEVVASDSRGTEIH